MRGEKTESKKRKTETAAKKRRQTARPESKASGDAPKRAKRAGASTTPEKVSEKPKSRGSAKTVRRTAVRRSAAPKPSRPRRTSVRRRGARSAPPVAPAETPSASRVRTRPEVERVLEEARVLAERPSDRASFPAEQELPQGYGKDLIVAMVRDPYWIHTYWELTQETLSRALRSLGKSALGARRILRVYSGETNAARPENFLFDVAFTPDARNWYINVGGPGRTYRVDIGLLTKAGKFVCLASSNPVSMPPDRMSDLLDEEWADLSPEYYAEIYALSGGLTASHPPLTSPGLAERLARRLEERLASPVFSPGVSAGIGARELERPFWLRLDADLIVYGATVPGSHLTVEGGTCSLREDGTFSFRCHLPDGKKEIKVTSRSEDGTKEEKIELTVTRSTR